MTRTKGKAQAIQLVVSPATDRNSIQIEARARGELLGSTRLNAAHVDRLIRSLARQRRRLHKAVTARPKPHEILEVTNAVWRMRYDDHALRRFVEFCHPGLGWIRFEFGHTASVTLATDLMRFWREDGEVVRWSPTRNGRAEARR
jgi:hypothetical protein